jgi:hypothetical protein
MTVTVNATATTPKEIASGTSTTNTTLTIASGATALLAILVTGGFGTAITSPSLHWDSTGTNQAMTLLVSITNGAINTSLFGLLSPTVGAKTLAASWTNSNPAVLTAIAFNGTATDTIANAFQNSNSNSGSGTSATVTGTSAAGNINVAAAGNIGNSAITLAATSSTSIFSVASNNGAAGGRAPGAATVAWTGTQTTQIWTIACVDVAVPAATLTWSQMALGQQDYLFSKTEVVGY